MWPFLILLLAAAWLQTAAVLALFGRRLRLLIVLTLAALMFSSYPWAVRINLLRLAAWLDQPAMLRDACAAVLVQSVTALLLGLVLLRRRADGKRPEWYLLLGLLPPALFPVGGFLALIWLFNLGLASGFAVTSALFAAGAAAIVLLLAGTIRFFAAGSGDRQIELVATIYLLEIAVATFLPVLASPTVVNNTTGLQPAALLPLPFMLLVVLFAMVFAPQWERFRHRRLTRRQNKIR